MELEILDERGLKHVSDCLHDAVFSKDQIVFDPAAKTVFLELWREVWEETTSERFLLFLRRWKAPHEKCLLSFGQVMECKRDRDDSLTDDQVNAMSFDAAKGEIMIVTATGDTIRLLVDKLEGWLRDLGEKTDKGLGKITIGLNRPLQDRSLATVEKGSATVLRGQGKMGVPG